MARMTVSDKRSAESGVSASVAALSGVGPARAESLADAGIRTMGELLRVHPRKYRALGTVMAISEVAEGQDAVISGKVVSATVSRPRGRRRSALAEIDDGTGRIRVVWFGQGYLRKQLKKGREISVEGAVKLHNEALTLSARVYAFDDEGRLGGSVIPLYSTPEGFPKRTFQAIIREALRRVGGEVDELFPEEVRLRREIPRRAELLRLVHHPRDLEEARIARRALAYEELFLFEASLALRRRSMEEARAEPIAVSEKVDARIRALFPFPFTGAQDRAIAEITKDLGRGHPMVRLLQGDVGSGKTVVAIYTLLAAVAAGRQAALMVPTEVLAEQHCAVLRSVLSRARVKVGLFKSGMTAAARREAREDLSKGGIDIAVGTHALLAHGVSFKDLAMAVIDEQHKFGVLQRKALPGKGRAPHTLVMTATPIPRTLALTVFGDLSISTIDELPPGRRAIETSVVSARRRGEVCDLVQEEVSAGRQAYIVYPVIDDSEALDLSGARQMHEKLSRETFPKARVGLLHGAMSSPEKAAAMEAFAAGRTDILVTTTVIEVGMDVPNATVMVVEHAERFGLAQLHQLRGRVGRGEAQGRCVLVSSAGGTTRRLDVLRSTDDGFRIAQEDMEMRGPGEFFGVHQHGLPDFQLADVMEDWDILQEAREDAFAWAYGEGSFGEAHSRAIEAGIEELVRGREDLADVG